MIMLNCTIYCSFLVSKKKKFLVTGDTTGMTMVFTVTEMVSLLSNLLLIV